LHLRQMPHDGFRLHGTAAQLEICLIPLPDPKVLSILSATLQKACQLAAYSIVWNPVLSLRGAIGSFPNGSGNTCAGLVSDSSEMPAACMS
jgi:hypothetical protein